VREEKINQEIMIPRKMSSLRLESDGEEPAPHLVRALELQTSPPPPPPPTPASVREKAFALLFMAACFLWVGVHVDAFQNTFEQPFLESKGASLADFAATSSVEDIPWSEYSTLFSCCSARAGKGGGHVIAAQGSCTCAHACTYGVRNAFLVFPPVQASRSSLRCHSTPASAAAALRAARWAFGGP
jgi:hypothetical protein